jgi:hypothetical protein
MPRARGSKNRQTVERETAKKILTQDRLARANALAHAEDAFVTISALRAGDDQRSQSKKERPSFVRPAQLGPPSFNICGRNHTCLLRVR